MCGIAGKLVFDRNKIVSNEMLQRMGQVIHHRGPDDQGTVVLGCVGLVSARLAIQDLSLRGHMPMCDAENKVWICHSGEVYNFRKLRKEVEAKGYSLKSDTDTEVILYLYKIHGVKFVPKLRGMFAFAIWDDEKQQLLLARDRLGQRPLKYYLDNEKLVFGSDLRSIFQDRSISKEVNEEAINSYLLYGFCPNPETAFKNTYKLPQGHILVCHKGKVKVEQYWQPRFTPKMKLSPQDAVVELRKVLIEATKVRLMGDVEIGLMLSGGIDSNVIAAILGKELGIGLRTFSVGFRGQGNELPYARMTAERYGTEHQEIMLGPNVVGDIDSVVRAFDEPFGDGSMLPTYLISREIRKHVKVALNGDGGDEAFAGYGEHRLIHINQRLAWGRPFFRLMSPVLEKLHRRMGRVTDILGSPLELAFYYYSTGYESGKFVRKHILGGRELGLFNEKMVAPDTYSLLDRCLSCNYTHMLNDRLMVKTDMAGLANSLETRSPFLDHHVVEFAMALPDKFKISGKQQKWILRQAFKEDIPAQIFTRPKTGFVLPIDKWLREDLHPLTKTISSDSSYCANYIRPQEIRDAVKAHNNQCGAWAPLLWNLIMLEKWKTLVYDPL